MQEVGFVHQYPARILIYGVIVLLTICSLSRAYDAEAKLLEADQTYALREDREQLLKSIGIYEEILKNDPQHYEASWKLSRAYWFLGYHTPREEQRTYLEQGIDHAKKATELNEKGCEGFFWMGVNYAQYADTASALKALSLIDDIKNSLSTALELNPNCECGGPQRVLGKVYSSIPWFKGGSKSKAIEYLVESLQECPQDTQSRIFLAEVYLDQGRKTEAIEQLKLVLQMEPLPGWLPETRENKELAEKMLQELSMKKRTKSGNK